MNITEIRPPYSRVSNCVVPPRPQLSEKTIVFYHADCTDGLAAALMLHIADDPDLPALFLPFEHKHTDVAHEIKTAMRYREAYADGSQPDTVIFLDCAPPTDALREAYKAAPAAHFWIYDHHKTSREEYADFSSYNDDSKEGKALKYRMIVKDDDTVVHTVDEIRHSGGLELTCYFCDTLSGAQLTFYLIAAYMTRWEANGGWAPWWICYVGDRDLWKHKLPDTEAINAGIWNVMRQAGGNVYKLKAALQEMGDFMTPIEPQPKGSGLDIPWLRLNPHLTRPLAEGRIVRQAVLLTADEVARSALPLADSTQLCNKEGISVLYTACPRFARSDAGAKMNERADIALLWHQDGPHTVQVSLRSNNGSEVDVGAIAKRHGGGGHKHAAGFVADYAKLIWMLNLRQP